MFPSKDLQISLWASSCLGDIQKGPRLAWSFCHLFLPCLFFYTVTFLSFFKGLVINEGADPDLRGQTWMHVPHVLPRHGILPTENQTCAPLKSPFGARKLGLNPAEIWNQVIHSLIYCTTTTGAAKQLQTWSWGGITSFILKENILFVCFGASAF